MKKFIGLVLSVVLVFSFVGCGKDKDTAAENLSSVLNGSSEEITSIENTSGTASAESENTTITTISSQPASITSKETSVSSVDNTAIVSSNELESGIKLLFKPSVIASTCVHDYSKASCTTPFVCSKCGDAVYRMNGQHVNVEHIYYNDEPGKEVNNICRNCGFERGECNEVNAHFFSLGQVITERIWMKTEESDITITPTITLYKYTKEVGTPYPLDIIEEKYYALPVTEKGDIISESGFKHGMWIKMTNEVVKQDSSILAENDFSEYRLIYEFTFKINEPGEYRTQVNLGESADIPYADRKYKFIIRTH